MRTLQNQVFVLLYPEVHWKAMTGHHQHIGHRQTGKWKCGPGGMNCPCCTKLSPNKLKPKYARWTRRKAKQTLTHQLDD